MNLNWFKNWLRKHSHVPHFLECDGVQYDVNTTDGAKAYEKACDESCDIYKIVARVKNKVTDNGLSLTSMGIGLCNAHANFLKELHRFSAKLDGENLIEFKLMLKRAEHIPANFIKAATPRKGK